MTQTTIDQLEKRTARAINLASAFADPDWKKEAEATVEVLIKMGEDFTSEEVWALLDQMDVKTSERRALGGIIRRFANEGKIRFISYRKSTRKERNRAPIAVWRPVGRYAKSYEEY
jgi:hypothetical protein